MAAPSQESLNPFSNRGQIRFASFLLTVTMAVALNLLVFLSIRGHLIVARSKSDVELSLALYAGWFLFFSLGYYFVSNAFIKRWAALLGSENLGSLMRLVLRVGLLSPVFSYVISILTLMYFPGSPLRSVGRGGSRATILGSLFVSLFSAAAATSLLPPSVFGLERVQFRKASESLEIELPEDSVSRVFLSVASPALRYLSWLGMDFVRARAIMESVELKPETVCNERLGFLGIEVSDCFFRNFRKSGEISPMISPYFGLFFETKYRQQTVRETRSAATMALNLLMLSNLLELVEPGPVFVDRRHLIKPAPLLFAFGSPEVPLIELGQDFQRVILLKRMLPVFELQLSTAQEFLKQSEATAVLESEGIDTTVLSSELRDLKIRIDSVRRDPLGIAHFFLGGGVGVGAGFGGSMKAGSPEKE